MKAGTMVGETGKALKFSSLQDVDDDPSAEMQEAVRVAAVVKEYRVAAKRLLQGKYSEFASIAPTHLREPCDVFVLRGSDGLIVRHDPASEPAKVRSAYANRPLSELVPQFSDQVIQLDVGPDELLGRDVGAKFQFSVVNADGVIEDERVVAVVLVGSTRPLDEAVTEPRPPSRPLPLVSAQSEFVVQVGGLITAAAPIEPTLGLADQRFLADTRMRLPVGWLAIDVYGLVPESQWAVEMAPTWAELDILAAVAQHNLRETQLAALDGRLSARQRYAELLDEFEGLLAGNEEPVHQFLKRHPELISPTSVRQWSKLRFGSRVSDFVFEEPHRDYELVELEAPVRSLFRRDGQQRQELTHAINQVADWLAFIETDRSKVEHDLGLVGISTSPRLLVVIGRSKSLSDENRRKLTTLQNQIPKLRILTYDDLAASARANLERILGPLSIRAGDNVRLYFSQA